MITAAEFRVLMSQAGDGVKDIAMQLMTNYTRAQVQPRDDFTERVLLMLEIVSGNVFNRDGSFTPIGAEQAYDDETRWVVTDFEFMIRVYHRLRELERGEVNFKWLEKSWYAYRKILYARGERRLAASISADIKAGTHKFTAPARPYVGKSVKEYAPILAHNIDRLLLSTLPIRRV